MRSHTIFLVVVVLSLVACSNTTPTPTSLPTVPPTPVESKVWEAPPVLVQYYSDYPSGIETGNWSSIPTLVLYATGQIVVAHTIYASNTWATRSMVTAQLSYSDVCAFLQNFIELGFFEPNALNYYPYQGSDSTTTVLTINGWRSHRLDIYGPLDIAPSTDYNGVAISPALANTLDWLNHYSPPQSQPYQPDRISLQAFEWAPGPKDLVEDWPFHDISLEAMANSEWQNASVEGAEAADIYSRFDSTWLKFYRENNIIYWVSVAPIVSLQVWDMKKDRYPSKYAFPDTPLRPMDCTGF